MAQVSVKIKDIAKRLSKYTPIDIKDISQPNSERIMDIIWCLACNLYTEENLSSWLKAVGNPSKVIAFSMQIHSVMAKLLPNLNFTMADLLFPTRERTAIILHAFANLLDKFESQSAIRGQLDREKEILMSQHERLQLEVLETYNKVKSVKQENARKADFYAKLQDKYLTLERIKNSEQEKCNEYQKQVEVVKAQYRTEQAKQDELDGELKKIDDQIDYFKSNIRRSKEELLERLEELDSENSALQRQSAEKSRRFKQLRDKSEEIDENAFFITETSNKLSEITSNIDIQRQRKLECKKELTLADQQNSQLESNVKKVQTRFAAVQDETKEILEELRGNCEALIAENEKLMIEMEDMQNARDANEKLSTSLDSRTAEAEKAYQGVTGKHDKFRSDIQSHYNQLHKLFGKKKTYE